KKNNEFLGKILIRNGYIKEEELLEALAEQFSLKKISLKYKYIDNNLLRDFSQTLILDYRCLPIERDKDIVTFAITNPLDAWMIKKAEEEAGRFKACFVLVSESDMEEALLRYRQYLKQNILKGI
ncbi:MAG: hypothetical protein NC826_02440, partial [Candidatus Omnitrophica bacterium]|nr:hypothetical protein [Candidatus Omnitrophota bacterium]